MNAYKQIISINLKRFIMKSKMKRLCIYPKDIMIITGKSERYSRKLLNRIKQSLGKGPDQFLTVKEFSEYSGLDEDEVTEIIQN